MRPIFRSQLVNQPFEMQGRLGALDDVALVENEQRYAAYPVLASHAEIRRDLCLAEPSGDGLTQLVAVKRNAGVRELHDYFIELAQVHTVLEVTTEQSFDRVRSLLSEASKVHDAVCELRIGRAFQLGEVECNAFSEARLSSALEDAAHSLFAAELALEKSSRRHALCW